MAEYLAWAAEAVTRCLVAGALLAMVWLAAVGGCLLVSAVMWLCGWRP